MTPELGSLDASMDALQQEVVENRAATNELSKQVRGFVQDALAEVWCTRLHVSSPLLVV